MGVNISYLQSSGHNLLPQDLSAVEKPRVWFISNAAILSALQQNVYVHQ